MRVTSLIGCSLSCLLLFTGLILAGCATDNQAAAPVVQVKTVESSLLWESEMVKGGPQVLIDFSGFEKGGIPLEAINLVELRLIESETGHEIRWMEWRDEAWHSGRGHGNVQPQSVWIPENLPSAALSVEVYVCFCVTTRNFLEGQLFFGPLAWDRGEEGQQTLRIALKPQQGSGAVKLTALNETGIGVNHGQGVGVYLTALGKPGYYHFHLPPGREYLTYEKKQEGLLPGDYSFTVHAWKDDNWPYYGNAVWEGGLTVRSGETTALSGEMSIKVAPWDSGLTVEDFQIQGEQTLYRTEFDEVDPQMGEPQLYEGQEEAPLEGGILKVAGEGDLSGGVTINTSSGENHLIRFRAAGEFFINTHVWSGNRLALIIYPRKEDRKPWFHGFALRDGRGIPGGSYSLPIPELNPEQWYDYALLDTGKNVYIFMDDNLVQILPVAEELPKKGSLNLEWHRPCQFDSLSVSSFESAQIPEEL